MVVPRGGPQEPNQSNDIAESGTQDFPIAFLDFQAMCPTPHRHRVRYRIIPARAGNAQTGRKLSTNVLWIGSCNSMFLCWSERNLDRTFSNQRRSKNPSDLSFQGRGWHDERGPPVNSL